jgi:hypothetical protein
MDTKEVLILMPTTVEQDTTTTTTTTVAMAYREEGTASIQMRYINHQCDVLPQLLLQRTTGMFLIESKYHIGPTS